MQDVFCFPLLDTQLVHSWDDILLQDISSRMIFWVISNEFKTKCKTRVSTGVSQCHSIEVSKGMPVCLRWRGALLFSPSVHSAELVLPPQVKFIYIWGIEKGLSHLKLWGNSKSNLNICPFQNRQRRLIVIIAKKSWYHLIYWWLCISSVVSQQYLAIENITLFCFS